MADRGGRERRIPSYGSYPVQKASAGTARRRFLSALGGGAVFFDCDHGYFGETSVRSARAACLRRRHFDVFGHDAYLRSLILLAIFDLGSRPHFCGLLWPRPLPPSFSVGFGRVVPTSRGQNGRRSLNVKNPLELSAAFLFALLFVVLLAASHYALEHFGRGGVYGLAAITGLTDIDPFVLGMTQSAGQSLPVAAHAIAIAASSNNVVRDFMPSVSLTGKPAGRR